jgi:DNA-binding response OmpR family regulator
LRILIVEDDAKLATHMQQRLRKSGFAVDLAGDGEEGEHLGREEAYDAIILDLGLPTKPGLEVLQDWRAADITTAVLILTARDAWYEKVEGFKAGADDYLAKPFHMEELLARLEALIRRSNAAPMDEMTSFGLRLDEDHQTVITPEGDQHELTGTEYRLLRYFMLHPGKVLSKTRLTDHVYEYDHDRDSNVIEVYVNRLRSKLGKDWIKTRRGQGYIFDKPAE